MDRLTAMGFPPAEPPRLVVGTIVACEVMRDQGYVLVSLEDEMWAGGGPLLNAHGQVIGVMSCAFGQSRGQSYFRVVGLAQPGEGGGGVPDARHPPTCALGGGGGVARPRVGRGGPRVAARAFRHEGKEARQEGHAAAAASIAAAGGVDKISALQGHEDTGIREKATETLVTHFADVVKLNASGGGDDLDCSKAGGFLVVRARHIKKRGRQSGVDDDDREGRRCVERE